MLVAALAMAVLFVSLALLLNTVIYTGNLATRSVGGDSDVIAEYRTAATDAADESLRRVNAHNNSDYAELETTFGAAMRDWDAATSRHRAVTSSATELRVAARTRGTRLRQDDFDREFLNETGAGNWSVAEGAGAYRDFSMTVNRSALTDVSGTDLTDASVLDAASVFHVTLETDAGEEYTAFVGRDGSSNVVVSVFGPSGTHRATCTAASGGDATVDFSDGTVGGADCEALTFEDGVRDTFTLRYGDGDAAGGTYSLVTDTPYGEYGEDFANDGGGSPYRTHALYGVELELVYRTSSTQYASRAAVIPNA
ncbi:hypothetical protein DWB78_03235 [Halopelagius longus]|uniref:Uncharacterized protein n=2 Tax=Halopelagius longus TaxID=1236180 RepID=A0A1H1BK11_9EURY|nr:hypothetical protein DWB78_03235 [Halopelagius longus]SDQ52335.1 hypothetical protein SAMN05216278_1835 [Halopelagius longus]